MSVRASCHCGAVTLTLAQAPHEVTNCNCSICRRYGTLWAYYQASEVVVNGATHSYVRGPETLAFRRCVECGVVTHWAPVRRAEDRMGINARLLAPELLRTVAVRLLDGAVTESYLDMQGHPVFS